MSLISKEDLIKAAGLNIFGFLKNPIASSLLRLTKINEVNALYDKLKDKEGEDFFNGFVKELELKKVVFE